MFYCMLIISNAQYTRLGCLASIVMPKKQLDKSRTLNSLSKLNSKSLSTAVILWAKLRLDVDTIILFIVKDENGEKMFQTWLYGLNAHCLLLV